MAPFTIPEPPNPRPGEVADYNGWDLKLRWFALKQAHEIATVREASDAANVAAQRALGEAMKAAAAMQLQAATAAAPADSDAKLLQRVMLALAAAGVDSVCLKARADAVMAAIKPALVPIVTDPPPRILPIPAPNNR